MEKLPIKLNDLNSVVNVLIEKIQLLDSGIFTKEQKLACTTEVLKMVDNLREFFIKADFDSSHYESKDVKEIEKALAQFEFNAATSPLKFKILSESGKLIISSLLKLLGLKGCGLLIIETYIKFCFKTVFELRQKVYYQNLSWDRSNMKLLFEGLSSTANLLKKYWHIAFSVEQKHTIMLCLHQICKILPYLLKMIEFQNTYLKKYFLDLLIKCLTKIQDEIHNNGDTKSKSCLSFILMMNFCSHKLNKLSDFNNDLSNVTEEASTTVGLLKPIIDELLYCVMSVAQVTTFQEDYYSVLTSSQKVLRELAELNEAIEKGNGCAIRLCANSLAECLYALEQRVNNAILKLVLEVFSIVNLPIKNILNKCKMDISKNNKTSEDLKILISEFDSEMDKIMQIGFFSISCTTSLNRVLNIQSCLASLESLETELILSLIALYVDCNAKNKTIFQWLFDFWLNEITRLKILIDSILDPAGFCEVVKNQIKQLRMTFKENASDFFLDNLNCNLKKAIRYSKKLIRTLKTNMEDEKEVNKTYEELLMKFQLALQECEAVLALMEGGQDIKKTINQAVKRYDLLVQNLEKLSAYLVFMVTDEKHKYNEKESVSNESSFTNVQVPQKNYYRLSIPSDDPFTTLEKVPEILTPYVKKGFSRSKVRNILYTTTVKDNKDEDDFHKTLSQTLYWDTTSAFVRSRSCKPLIVNSKSENTIDLEFTTIFENISKLSDTYLNRSTEIIIKKREKSNTENGNNSTKPKYTSTGCSTKSAFEGNEEHKNEENFESEKTYLGVYLKNDFHQSLRDLSHNDSLLMPESKETSSYVDSPDRMNDLKIVEEKINFLKARMPLELNYK